MSKNGIQPHFVVSATALYTPDNLSIIGYRCRMSDNSFWTCNDKGKGWKKETLSDDELTEQFREFIKKREEIT